MAAFPLLFSTLTINSCVLKNRIVSSGHDTVMIENGQITDQLIAYHGARAEGGVGLIIVQVAGVHEAARYTAHILMAHDDSCIAGYSKLADTIHDAGAKVFGQLFHPGREVMESQDGSSPVAVAPSAVPNERFHVMPRALRSGEIDEIVEGYASAAARLERAGLDGVEVVASHGYLPAQFLNPHVNHRDDEYGGNEENRQRFLWRVLDAIRQRVGREFVVGVRVSLGEFDPLGLDEETIVRTCARLGEHALVDYVSVTTGTSASLVGSDHISPEMGFANGFVAPRAQRMKGVVQVPVFVAGRINQPQEAERILALEQADACIMTRALICDPLLPRLAFEGRPDHIRACIGCNQACIGHFHLGYPISCIQHPETGRELRFGKRRRAGVAHHVLVVGGGPGGLKAAAVAAERGHRVTLYEASGRLGGQIRLAELLPGREEFGGATMNLHLEAKRAGVSFVMNGLVDRALVETLNPDVVVVATGATPYRPPLEVRGDPVLLDAWQVLGGESPPKGHTVVVDWRGDWIGIGVARLLAAKGHRVTLCVSGYAAGEALQQYVRDASLGALQRERIDVRPLVRIFGVDDDSVYLQHVLTEEMIIESAVTGVVLSCGHRSVTALLGELETGDRKVVGVGDCLAPRTVEEAVLEGLVVGSSL